MVLDVNFDEVFENVMMNAVVAACGGDGVLDGLAVSENGAGASMHVDVAAGNAWISGTKYTEAGITEDLVITAAHATLDRKDLVVYDSSAGNPAVVAGTAAAIPEPPDIPAGDILLAIVDVGAAVTQIANADITDGRVIISDTTHTHGASAHTDVTRELFIPITYGDDGISVVNTDYVGAKMTDNVNKNALGMFKVPVDYVSAGVLKVIVMPKGTGNISNQIEVNHAADGQMYSTHTQANTLTYEAVTTNYVEILSNTLTFSALAVGDVVGCRYLRYGNFANDTVNADAYCLGFIFSYTANQ